MRKCLLFPAVVVCGGALAADQPNIIVFMVDDLGWNHSSAEQPTMGTSPEIYHTPNLEKLADGGVSFTHAYAQPNCAPTRAAMLTGQYPARVHNDVYVVGNLNRHGRGGVSKDEAKFRGPEQSEDVAAQAVTIAEALKKNGYATAHIGKYHVGGHSGPETLPEQQGFDINLGGCDQGHQPTCFASKQKDGWCFKGVGLGHFDRWAEPYDKAYLAKREWPGSLEGTPKHISDALGDALEDTVGKLAAGEAPFYLQFHTYAVHGPVRARPDLCDAAMERASGKKQAEYFGFIAGVDENLGRMLRILGDPDGDGDVADSILENTLILFTSDNGGTHADNLPLKGVKGMFAEGGTRVPLIAFWKGKLPPGKTSDRMVHAVDYYPTCLELAGRRWMPPADEHPLDGESFAAEMRAPGSDPDRGPVCFLFPGYLDRRAAPGAWVVDEIGDKRFKAGYDYESGAWSLHCLTDDIGETVDLSGKQPEVLKSMASKLDGWLRQEHPTWQPKYPILKETGQSAGPPPVP